MKHIIIPSPGGEESAAANPVLLRGQGRLRPLPVLLRNLVEDVDSPLDLTVAVVFGAWFEIRESVGAVAARFGLGLSALLMGIEQVN